ncbi:hypothetical protein DXG03_002276 [Asterophora parasitica]|uniref:Uncharacterized protein n=1 Tax=Asterophora parasitica TaxID=117018 RepID=A0A9P7K8S6_9AGAR|nr:hypothetical protein DXG03_002276 [Asterophora parasitica]
MAKGSKPQPTRRSKHLNGPSAKNVTVGTIDSPLARFRVKTAVAQKVTRPSPVSFKSRYGVPSMTPSSQSEATNSPSTPTPALRYSRVPLRRTGGYGRTHGRHSSLMPPVQDMGSTAHPQLAGEPLDPLTNTPLRSRHVEWNNSHLATEIARIIGQHTETGITPKSRAHQVQVQPDPNAATQPSTPHAATRPSTPEPGQFGSNAPTRPSTPEPVYGNVAAEPRTLEPSASARPHPREVPTQPSTPQPASTVYGAEIPTYPEPPCNTGNIIPPISTSWAPESEVHHDKSQEHGFAPSYVPPYSHPSHSPSIPNAAMSSIPLNDVSMGST